MRKRNLNGKKIWIGRVLALAILVAAGTWMWQVGLTKASATGGAAGLLVAFAALLAPYLFPANGNSFQRSEGAVVGSGKATSISGVANTGILVSSEGHLEVTNSGDAFARGTGSKANTGIDNG